MLLSERSLPVILHVQKQLLRAKFTRDFARTKAIAYYYRCVGNDPLTGIEVRALKGAKKWGKLWRGPHNVDLTVGDLTEHHVLLLTTGELNQVMKLRGYTQRQISITRRLRRTINNRGYAAKKKF